MTETFQKVRIHTTDHTKFGGYIFPSDFNTDNRGKNNTNGSFIAIRISEDELFDLQCKMNKEGKNITLPPDIPP